MGGVQAIQQLLEGLVVCSSSLCYLLKRTNLLRLSKKEKISERLQKEEITSFSTIINQGEIKLELIYDMNKSWGSHISRRLLNKRPCLS